MSDITQYCIDNDIDPNLDYDDKCVAIVNCLGVDAVASYLPFTEEDITDCISRGDTDFNDLPLRGFQLVSGVTNDMLNSRSEIRFTSPGLCDLLSENGLTVFSLPMCVSLLKTAARLKYSCK